MPSVIKLELDSFHEVLTPRCSSILPATPQHKKLRTEHKKGGEFGGAGEEYFAYSCSMRKVDLHIKQYNKKYKSGT